MKKIGFLLAGAAALVWGGTLAAEPSAMVVRARPDQAKLLAGGEREVVVLVEWIAPKGQPKKRAPLNLALVLDRSGSMAGRKLEQARQAAAMVVDRLSPQDRAALVVYDDEVQVLVPSQKVESKAALKRKIAGIESGGSTALYAGVEAGGRQVAEHAGRAAIDRVILLSDGLANVGPSSNGEIARLGKKLARDGVSVTTIGLGEDYNEDLMAALAEASDANYYYVQDTEKLPEIFAEELKGLLAVTARNIKVTITLPEGVRPLEIIGLPAVFEDRKAVLSFGPMAAGQRRQVLVRCRVPADEAGSRQEIAAVTVTYDDETSGKPATAVASKAVIAVTDSEADALASVDAEVAAERELQVNAVEKEKALADADAGRNAPAAGRLKAQSDKLRALASTAPAPMAAKLEGEADALDRYAQEVGEKGFTKQSRKDFQYDTYQKKNSKK